MADAVAHDRFLRLFDAHGAAVLALLRRLCGNTSDADDLFQETAVRVWRVLPGDDRLDNPRGWLTTIAYRLFVDSRRRRRPVGDLAVETACRAESHVDVIERTEEADRAREALDELSEPVREVFLLHYAAGLSLRETGEAMGITEGTVKSRLNRGLRTLRRVLR